MFTRSLALLLALIISGPTCWCREPQATQPPVKVHSCCKADPVAAETPASHKAPDMPCACNKCLVKRDLANGPVHAPPATWIQAAPIVFVLERLIADTYVAAVHFAIDTGPPHDRQAMVLRQGALLL